MAKKLKDAAGSGSKIAGLDADKFHHFTRTIRSAKARRLTSAAEERQAKREAKDAGLHMKAWTLADELDGWEDDKRNDFLRAFDQCRREMNLDRALDMFDQPVASFTVSASDVHEVGRSGPDWEGNDAPFDVDQPGESGEEVIPAAAAEDEQQEEAAAAEPETAADWRDAVIAAEDMPHDAGACFNGGVDARKEGLGENANPHDPAKDPARARIWLDGWQRTDADMRDAALAADVATAEADVAADAADNVRPFPTPAAEDVEQQDVDAEDEPAEKPKRSRRAVASAVPPSRFEPGAAYTV